MTTYVTAAEAARMLGVTKPTLYAYVSRGAVGRRTAPDGRTSLYARDEVERLAARARRRERAERSTIDVEVESAITELNDSVVSYRGHDVAELARTRSYEQVAELMWTGTLPTGEVTWPIGRADLTRCRAVVDAAGQRDPMVALALAATTLDGAVDGCSAARRLLAIVPSLLGGRQRGDLATRLCTAWHRAPTDEHVAAVSRALVLLADHELASSTLAVRVACSVRAEPGAAIAAGLQVARGPLHGGASRQVVALLEHAERVDGRNAVRAALAGGARLPGFGHSIYRDGDPRLAPLLDAVRAIPGEGGRVRVVDEVLAEAGRSIGRLPNVDLGIGALLFVGRMPADAPLFAVARIAGWAAHYDEEAGERAVRYRGLTRPRSGRSVAATTVAATAVATAADPGV